MTTASIVTHVCGTNPAKGLFTGLIAQSDPVKTCKKCGECKLVAAFSKDKSKPGGLCAKCKACAAEHNAAWHAANKDRVREYSAAYYAENKELMREYYAARYAANPERARELTAAWSAANPDARRIHKHNRRARESQNGGALSKGITAKLFKLQQGQCACCKADLKSTKHHLDHIMPLALGGPNTDDNVQLLCPSCNCSKHAKHPIEFMQSRGFLL